MTHQADCSVIETVVQLLCENGLSHMADAMRLMLNEAMRIERSQALEAGPYQRTEKRRGYANGFKPKTVSTRLGELALEVPQGRGGVLPLGSGARCAERAGVEVRHRRDVCAGRVHPKSDGGDGSCAAWRCRARK